VVWIACLLSSGILWSFCCSAWGCVLQRLPNYDTDSTTAFWRVSMFLLLLLSGRFVLQWLNDCIPSYPEFCSIAAFSNLIQAFIALNHPSIPANTSIPPLALKLYLAGLLSATSIADRTIFPLIEPLASIPLQDRGVSISSTNILLDNSATQIFPKGENNQG